MTRIERIKKLLDVLKPQYLNIVDKSAAHQEHFKAPQSSQTHLVINISSNIFQDKTNLAQHRMIKDLLAQEFESGLHALSINIKKHETNANQ